MITPFDLHVLSTPPAFILSQDQTLEFIFFDPVQNKLGFFFTRILYLVVSFWYFFFWKIFGIFQGCITVYLSRSAEYCFALLLKNSFRAFFLLLFGIFFPQSRSLGDFLRRNGFILPQPFRIVKPFFKFLKKILLGNLKREKKEISIS